MEDDGELIFTKDCIVNLDDIGDLEDYHELIREVRAMLATHRYNEQLFVRLFESETDYIFQEEGITELLGELLRSINSYSKFRDNIIAMVFEFVQDCLLSRQLEDNGIIGLFLDTLQKHKTEVSRMLLLHFLSRMAWKIIYVEDEEQRRQLLRFLDILLRQNKQPTEKQSYLIVEIVDVFLRHKWARLALRPFYQRLTEQPHLGAVLKFFSTKYSHYLRQN